MSPDHSVSASDGRKHGKAQRAKGSGRVSFKPAHDAPAVEGSLNRPTTRLDRLYQQGCAKIRLPKVYGSNAAEAVLINSSGGLTGGDEMTWDLVAGNSTHVVATTQACEKVYKSDGSSARVDTAITVGEDARLDWLPQETILFDRSGLARTITVDLAASARFMAVESVLLGRLAMGERVHDTAFRDTWTIRRAGRLIHADALRLEGDATAIGCHSATLGGHLAFSTLLYCGPDDADSLALLADSALAILQREDSCHGGVSTFGGKLIIRLTAPDGLHLRKALIPLISHMRAGEPLPRVWTT